MVIVLAVVWLGVPINASIKDSEVRLHCCRVRHMMGDIIRVLCVSMRVGLLLQNNCNSF